MAAKKKETSKKHILHKKIVVHHRLEKPVHNVVGYTILLVLAILTLFVIFSTQQGV